MKKLFANNFVRSTFFILSGSMLANVLNYLFNLLLGRMMSPSEYGEVAAIVTLAMIVVVPATTLSVVASKNMSEHVAKEEHRKIRGFYKLLVKYGLWIGVAMLVVFAALSFFLSGYLKINRWSLVAFSFYMPLVMLLGVGRGSLQGLHLFRESSTTTVIESAFKLIAAIALVWMGLSVNGAIGGMVIGSLIALAFAHYKIRPQIAQHDSEAVHLSKPRHLQIIFWSSLFLSLFDNFDVVLAKHYLNDVSAGHYGALAVLGRVVTYASLSVIVVLLPMASAAKAKDDYGKAERLLWISIAATVGISSLIVLAFYLFSEPTVRYLFGESYMPIAEFLGIFGLVNLLGSTAKVFINYFLAIHQHYFILPFASVTILQIFLIVMHHTDISQMIKILTLTNIFLFVSMIIIYVLTRQKSINTAHMEGAHE